MTRLTSRTAFREVVSPLPFPQKRIAPFSFRLTSDEVSELEKRADGMPLGAFTKSKVLTSGPGARTRASQVDRQELAKVLAALGGSRLSQNINHIAKAAHLGTLPISPETEEEIKQACYNIACMRMMLIKALGKQDGGGP